MATITSVGTGDWGTAGTWDAGVPVDNDTVVIASGHVVTFNVDQSGFANGIAGITVTGTLSLTRTAGTYYMKIKAATTIGGAGTFDCGTSVSPIPFAAKHTVTGGAAWYINGAAGLTMTVYAAEPTVKTILLSGDEAIGQTELSVDTDVTGDIWADGDTIRIDDINKAAESEERVIDAAGIAAGTITVTAGLTAAKSTGAVVSLVTRSVKFIGVGATGYIAQNFASGKLTVAGGQWTTATFRAFNSCAGITFTGGTFCGHSSVMVSCAGATVSGGVFSGNTSVFSGDNITVSGGYFSGTSGQIFGASKGVYVSGGTFKGNTYVFNATVCPVVNAGAFYGNGSCFWFVIGALLNGGTYTYQNYCFYGSSITCKNANISLSSTADIYQSQIIAFNTVFGSTTENSGYTSHHRDIYSESLDHDQTAGKFAAWTKGGVTASATTPVPTGYTTSYIITLADASNEGFWQREYTVGAGASVNITMNLRKSASMTYLPRCIIFNKASTDPFAGGAGISTFTMTDSVDTFEASTYTYYNSTANDVTLVIRFQGKNASGTVTTTLLVEQINVDLTTLINNLATVDTVVDAIKVKTDNLPSDPADESLIQAAIAAIDTDSVMSSTVEGTITVQQALRLLLAAMAGKASGGGTTAVTFRDTTDTTDRIVATVDSNGNRSVVTLDPT